MHKNIFKYPNLSIKNYEDSFTKDQADRWLESSLDELNWLEGEIKLFGKTAVTFSINKSDAVTSVSQSLKEDTQRLFNTQNDIKVVPNFIDIDKYKMDFKDCDRDLLALPLMLKVQIESQI